MPSRNPKYTEQEDIAFLRAVYNKTLDNSSEKDSQNRYFSAHRISWRSDDLRFRKLVPAFVNGKELHSRPYRSNARKSLQKHVKSGLVDYVRIGGIFGFRANLTREDEIKKIIGEE
jgi:hypothetical protein